MKRTTCAWFDRDEVFEDYVRDGLGPEDRDAFEAHYFSCEACFDRLQTVLALRAELASAPAAAHAPAPAADGWPRRWVLVPLGGALVLGAAAALWFRTPVPAKPEATITRVPPPAASPAAPPSTVARDNTPQPQAARQEAQPPASVPARPAAPPVVALSVLARVDPPPYVPVALRGARDEAAEKFDAAMRLYAAGDYAGAAPGLRAAADLKPDAPRAWFFLAACELLRGNADAAAAGLERTIQLGDSPYLEEAHFYLAKARLRQGRMNEARAELQRAMSQHGRLEQESRRLLAQLDALAAGKDRPPDA
jgi:TolA-binding protein